MQKLPLVILVIFLLGCKTTFKKDHNVTNSFPENKEDALPEGFKEKRKPPKELKLTSILYELAVAPEPEIFAKKHDIFLSIDRVRVFIFFDPASSSLDRENIVENYNIVVEKKSNGLLRALVPIDGLIPLSNESVIWSIRLPDRLIKPRK